MHVFTSDVRGAGTDGDVFLQLKGDKGAMGETKLENAGEAAGVGGGVSGQGPVRAKVRAT